MCQFCLESKYLKKGDKIYVEGRIKTRKWQSEDGVQRYSTEIHANEFNFLNTKNDVISENNEKNSINPNTEASLDDSSDDLPF